MSKIDKGERVTLGQVAAEAGVSTTTASLILKRREEYLTHFRPETVQRVVATANRLGYRSNLFALSLDLKASSFFALVLHAPMSGQIDDWLTKVNVDDFLAGAVEAAAKARVYPIIGMAGVETEATAVHSIIDLIGGGVFGTVVQTPSCLLEQALIDRLKRQNRLGVAFPRRLELWESNAIDVDNVRVAELSAELLTREGRRRWAIAYDETDQRGKGLALRRNTFARLAKEAGTTIHSIPIPVGADHLVTRDLLASELRRFHVDGLLAPSLTASVGAVLACRQAGLKPGDDLAIIGCDCPQWSTGFVPRITRVDVSWNDAGQVATRRLLELRDAGENRFDNVLLAPRVARGDTCAVPEGFPGLEISATLPLDPEERSETS